MAEVLFAFEHSDPDACALLLPWQADVAFGQLEVRARRQHPELPPLARADLVTRATALYDLVVAETARRADKPVGETAPPPVTEPERQRRRDLLLAEVTRNPALAAEEGRRFLEAELGISIPKGTFYGGYWNAVMGRLPAEARHLRQKMTARRPGGRKLDLSSDERAQVLQVVAVMKRDHPDYHQGQMLDEATRLTGHTFRDPVAFKRNYIDRVQAAPPVDPEQDRNPPALLAVIAEERPRLPEPSTENTSIVASAADITPGPSDGGIQALLLAAADTIRPAELSESPDGLAQVRLNLRPMKWSASHRLMSTLHAALAEMMAQAEE